MTDMDEDLPAGDLIERDAARVRAEYERRAADPILRDYYRRIGPIVERADLRRRSAVLEILDRVGPRESLRLLDAGCGRGDDLAFLVEEGFPEEHLTGIDVFAPAIDEARRRLPSARIDVGNVAELGLPSNTFDVVTQTTVLSSVVDSGVQQAIGSEILRVLKPGGVAVSYDLLLSPRKNPHLVSVSEADLRRIFAGGRIERLERMTLISSIAQRVPDSVRGTLEKVPWLRGNLLAVVRKPT